MDERLEALLISVQLRTLGVIQQETEEYPDKWFAHLAASLMEDKLTQRLSELHVTDVPRDEQEFIQSI